MRAAADNMARPPTSTAVDEPIAAPQGAPLELKLKIMLRNWSYQELKEVLYREAREGSDHREAGVYKRLYAYLKALELRSQSLSYSEVRGAIKGEIGYAPSKGELSEWLRGIHTPLGRITVFDVHAPEVGLVMGLILSDGNERQCYRHDHIAHARGEFYNTDENLLRTFEQACHKLGLSTYKRPDKSPLNLEYWRIETTSALLYLLLKRYDEFIIKAPANVQWAFIKGLMLGDGCIGCATFCNTDLKIIRTVSTILRMHGIGHTIQGPYPSRGLGKKSRYAVYVRKYSRDRFLELAGLTENPTH